MAAPDIESGDIVGLDARAVRASVRVVLAGQRRRSGPADAVR